MAIFVQMGNVSDMLNFLVTNGTDTVSSAVVSLKDFLRIGRKPCVLS